MSCIHHGSITTLKAERGIENTIEKEKEVGEKVVIRYKERTVMTEGRETYDKANSKKNNEVLFFNIKGPCFTALSAEA